MLFSTILFNIYPKFYQSRYFMLHKCPSACHYLYFPSDPWKTLENFSIHTAYIKHTYSIQTASFESDWNLYEFFKIDDYMLCISSVHHSVKSALSEALERRDNIAWGGLQWNHRFSETNLFNPKPP